MNNIIITGIGFGIGLGYYMKKDTHYRNMLYTVLLDYIEQANKVPNHNSEKLVDFAYDLLASGYVVDSVKRIDLR